MVEHSCRCFRPTARCPAVVTHVAVMCRDGQLSLEESWRVPSPEDVVQSSEIGTDALSRAEEEQNLAERPEDELEAMQARGITRD